MSKKICKPCSPPPPCSLQTTKTTDLYSQFRILTHFFQPWAKHAILQNTLPISASRSETSQVWSFVHSEKACCFCINMRSADLSIVDCLQEEALWVIYFYCNVLHVMRSGPRVYSEENVFAVSSDSCNILQSHANAGSRPSLFWASHMAKLSNMSRRNRWDNLICAMPSITPLLSCLAQTWHS